MYCNCIKKLCLKIFPEEEKPVTHNVFKGSDNDDAPVQGYKKASVRPKRAFTNRNRTSITTTRSASTVTTSDGKDKRHKSNSIFGHRSTCTIIRRESLEKERRRAKKSLIPNSTETRKKSFEDPVRDQWANKGTTIYTTFDELSGDKPTKYWVQTELQYVVLLPTQTRKRKSEVRPQGSVSSLPSQLSQETFSQPTPRRSLPSSMRQTMSTNPKQSLPSDTRHSLATNARQSLPSDTRESWPSSQKKSLPSNQSQSLPSNPRESLPASKLSQASKKPPSKSRKSNSSSSSSSTLAQMIDTLPKNKSNAAPKKKKNSSDSSSTETDAGFQSRAAAKPAPKAKGRFCCAKRQDSG